MSGSLRAGRSCITVSRRGQWLPSRLPSPVALDNQLQGLARPGGVAMTAFVLPGHLPTVERRLPARVLSSEVSMTQCRRPKR